MKAKYLLAIVCALAILIGAASGYAAFDKGAKGDLKEAYLVKFEAKAEALGLTVEEFKEHLSEQFEAKAEAMGMTPSEFKEQFAEKKKHFAGIKEGTKHFRHKQFAGIKEGTKHFYHK